LSWGGVKRIKVEGEEEWRRGWKGVEERAKRSDGEGKVKRNEGRVKRSGGEGEEEWRRGWSEEKRSDGEGEDMKRST
jgi:hypothetical protein